MCILTTALMCLLNNPYVHIYEREFEVSAYTASVEETDANPCQSADGTDVCAKNNFRVVASNGYSFATPIYISGRRFEVRDRMAKRYSRNFLDLLFKTREEAINFGRHKIKATVYERLTIQRAMCYE